MMRPTLAPLVIPILVAVPGLASAGWSAKQTHRTDAAAPAQKSDLYFENDLFRIDQEDNTSVIIDLNAGKFTFLSHAQKKHASITIEELLKMRDQMLAQMKAQLPNMPPEVRKQMEAQLKEVEGTADAKNAIEPKATGKKDKVNGYDCAIYRWSANDGDGEACIASSVGADIGSFSKATAKLSDKLSAMSGGKGSPAAFAMLQLGKHGLPVRTKRTMKLGGSTVDAVSEISDIKAVKLEPAKFQVPKDYAQGDLKSIMGAGGKP